MGRPLAGPRRLVRRGRRRRPLHGLSGAAIRGPARLRDHRRPAAHHHAQPAGAGGHRPLAGSGRFRRWRRPGQSPRRAIARQLHRLLGSGHACFARQADVEPPQRRLLPELPRAARALAEARRQRFRKALARRIQVVSGARRRPCRRLRRGGGALRRQHGGQACLHHDHRRGRRQRLQGVRDAERARRAPLRHGPLEEPAVLRRGPRRRPRVRSGGAGRALGDHRRPARRRELSRVPARVLEQPPCAGAQGEPVQDHQRHGARSGGGVRTAAGAGPRCARLRRLAESKRRRLARARTRRAGAAAAVRRAPAPGGAAGRAQPLRRGRPRRVRALLERDCRRLLALQRDRPPPGERTGGRLQQDRAGARDGKHRLARSHCRLAACLFGGPRLPSGLRRRAAAHAQASPAGSLHPAAAGKASLRPRIRPRKRCLQHRTRPARTPGQRRLGALRRPPARGLHLSPGQHDAAGDRRQPRHRQCRVRREAPSLCGERVRPCAAHRRGVQDVVAGEGVRAAETGWPGRPAPSGASTSRDCAPPAEGSLHARGQAPSRSPR